MLAYLRKVTRRAQDRGASAVEYGLMVAAIAAVIVVAVFGLGNSIKNSFENNTAELCSQDGGLSCASPTPSS